MILYQRGDIILSKDGSIIRISTTDNVLTLTVKGLPSVEEKSILFTHLVISSHSDGHIADWKGKNGPHVQLLSYGSKHAK